MTTPETEGDRAARAWGGAMALAGRCSARGRGEWRAPGMVLAVTGALDPILNGVFCTDAEPRADELARVVADQDWTGLPWCVSVRGRPGDEVLDVAARHGLTAQTTLPFLVIDLPGATAARQGAGPVVVRPVAGDEAVSWNATVTAAFGVPPEVFAPVDTPALLDAPEVTGHLAEVGGEPVGTSLGVVVDGCVSVFNVGTVPGRRRSGTGRAVMTAALRGGAAAGATLGVFHATELGALLYATLGARTVESWTLLTAP
jgi:N-acetylglutamate synthase